MARPRVRTHRIEIRLSDQEHAALVAVAGGEPLGPALVARALGRDAPSPKAVTSAVRAIEAAASRAPVVGPLGPRELVAALEVWATRLDRRSTSKLPALRCLAELARLVRDA